MLSLNVWICVAHLVTIQQFNGCWEILLQTTNVNLMVVLEKKSEDHQSLQGHNLIEWDMWQRVGQINSPQS